MKKIICIFISILTCFILSSCDSEGNKNYEETVDLAKIPYQENLYYKIDTKIIYFIFNERFLDCGYGYMAPYYSENGNLCRWDPVEDKIVEIEK